MQRTVRILAIDREEIILKSVRKALKSNEDVDYVVTTCSTALDSLKLVRSYAFDLVFIDLVLPGMNGIELFRRIKNISPSIPVIIMSGYSSERTSLDEALDGASGFLLKPFTTEEIKSLVSRILESKEQSA